MSNLCKIHNQEYTKHCVYCGPPEKVETLEELDEKIDELLEPKKEIKLRHDMTTCVCCPGMYYTKSIGLEFINPVA